MLFTHKCSFDPRIGCPYLDHRESFSRFFIAVEIERINAKTSLSFRIQNLNSATDH